MGLSVELDVGLYNLCVSKVSKISSFFFFFFTPSSLTLTTQGFDGEKEKEQSSPRDEVNGDGLRHSTLSFLIFIYPPSPC